MSQKVRLAVPEAPSVEAATAGSQRELNRKSLRIGVLDNSKGNADHLLHFIVAGIKAVLPVKSVIALRKATAGMAASAAIIDELTAEADFVVSAMAD